MHISCHTSLTHPSAAIDLTFGLATILVSLYCASIAFIVSILPAYGIGIHRHPDFAQHALSPYNMMCTQSSDDDFKQSPKDAPSRWYYNFRFREGQFRFRVLMTVSIHFVCGVRGVGAEAIMESILSARRRRGGKGRGQSEASPVESPHGTWESFKIFSPTHNTIEE